MLKLALLAAAAIAAGAVPVPPADRDRESDQLTLGQDRDGRMTVPVRINGAGPYDFVVDTGAERTVVSEEVAAALKLGQGRPVRMHSMTEVRDVDTVVIPYLGVHKKVVTGIHAPALAGRDVGADGMLGVDSLQAQRVLFDFPRQAMWISSSRKRIPGAPRLDEDTILVQARSRYGRLVLTNVVVDGTRVLAVIDTGSSVTIGNAALRRKLARRGKVQRSHPIELLSVTGGTLRADYGLVSRLSIGRINFSNMPVAFADAHPFHKLDLVDRPAILLGMNTLSRFERVSIDFANRDISFDMPDLSRAADATRLAFAEPAGAAIRQ